MLKIFSFVTAFVFLAFAYLFFTDSSEISIDEQGRIASYPDHIRASLQGARFWKNQLKLVDVEISKTQDRIQKDPERRALLKKFDEKKEQRIEKLSSKFMDPREVEAARLRNEAERLESDALDDRIQEFRARKLERLHNKREIIIKEIQTK